MKLEKLIDNHGDDIFALALIVTKDFNSAKEVFVRVTSDYYEIRDDCSAYDEIIAKTYSICREADSNDSAVTLTGVELDSKREALLQIVLQKPLIVRSIIHLCYEHELDEAQIASVTGESVKYITKVLSELPTELKTSLEKHYMEICAKIVAEDSLKAYVIRSAAQGGRMFEVKNEAVPLHTWSKKQKIIVIIAAIVVTAVATIVIPLLDSYIKMEEELRDYSYEEAATDEIFRYTAEAEAEQSENPQ